MKTCFSLLLTLWSKRRQSYCGRCWGGALPSTLRHPTSALYEFGSLVAAHTWGRLLALRVGRGSFLCSRDHGIVSVLRSVYFPSSHAFELLGMRLTSWACCVACLRCSADDSTRENSAITTARTPYSSWSKASSWLISDFRWINYPVAFERVLLWLEQKDVRTEALNPMHFLD